MFRYGMTDERGCALAITLAKEDEELPSSAAPDSPQLLRHMVTRLAAEAGLVAMVHTQRFDCRSTFVELFWVCAPSELHVYTSMPEPCAALDPLSQPQELSDNI